MAAVPQTDHISLPPVNVSRGHVKRREILSLFSKNRQISDKKYCPDGSLSDKILSISLAA
jgi:hypothetical protein